MAFHWLISISLLAEIFPGKKKLFPFPAEVVKVGFFLLGM